MIPVEGHKNLFRDEKTGAIVNCDTFAYSQYIRMKEDRKRQREEIDQIKSDINEIKSLLKEFLNGSRQN
jgi:predicted transcriptional regulator